MLTLAFHCDTRSTLPLSYLTLLSYTPKNSGCLAHHILTTYSSADLPVGSGTPLRKLRIVSSWLFIKWRNERTSDWKKKKYIYLYIYTCIHMYVFIYQDNSFTIEPWLNSQKIDKANLERALTQKISSKIGNSQVEAVGWDKKFQRLLGNFLPHYRGNFIDWDNPQNNLTFRNEKLCWLIIISYEVSHLYYT